MPAAPEEPGPRDSLRVRDQPALTTSSGRIWLLLGGLLTVITVVVMVPLLSSEPQGVALTGIVLTLALYVVMLLAMLVAAPRRRLGLMAFGMIGIALVAVLCLCLIGYAEWTAIS
jgi:hypothetical protein